MKKTAKPRTWKYLTFEEKFEKLEGWLVGLWKFRVYGESPTWCTTYVIDGCYYDTFGKKTREEALDAMYRVLRQKKLI